MLRKFASVLAIGLLATAAQAQSYPDKPIRMVIPFPPGGGTDILGRLVAQKLTEANKWTVVPDNRAGAGGTLGISEAAQATSRDAHADRVCPKLLASTPTRSKTGCGRWRSRCCLRHRPIWWPIPRA